ncbi:hypothetical protein BVRB_041480, partial [Beta vulgaris subsp. vulgaris]
MELCRRYHCHHLQENLHN